MGWIQEIADLFGKLAFYRIVYEYEQGLYFRAGIVQERRISNRQIKPERLEKLVEAEKKAYKDAGGFKAFLPFRRPVLPKGYHHDWIAGRPRHPERYDKVLKPGLYFHLPLIDDIVTDHVQEVPLDCNFSTIPVVDDGASIGVSCNILYQVTNFYLAYNEVYDYKRSIETYARSILAIKGRGLTRDQWKEPATLARLEKEIKEELRERATEKWGIRIIRVYLSDILSARGYKLLEGTTQQRMPMPVPEAD